MRAKAARQLDRFPRAVRWAAAGGLALTVAYLALYVAMRQRDPDMAAAMLRMYGLTIVAGRETAVFDALLQGMPPTWAYGLSVIDDIGSFLLALPFTWLVVHGLRRLSWMRGTLARFETQALVHRHWVRRWGLWGLAVLYFMPGLGAGVPATCILGVLARMPFSRMIPFFAAATLIVDALWAFSLVGLERALPESRIVDAFPLAVVGLVVLATAIGIWRRRKTRHIILLDWPRPPAPADLARLAEAGVESQGDVVRVDLNQVAAATKVTGRTGRRVWAAELLLLGGMSPTLAGDLARASVGGLDEVAASDADAFAGILQRHDVPDASAQAQVWVEEARQHVEAQNEGWTRRFR